jgi:Fuc2NAc and GlcNAc transferase
MIFHAFFIFLSLLFAVLATGLVRNYALKKNIIDTPVGRSSHTVPTPRGGGVSFVAATILACGVMFLLGNTTREVVEAVALGGGAVALAGWLDDRGGMRRRYRFAVHLLAAAWALWCIPCPPVISFGVAELRWGWLGHVFFFIALVWLINSYNFMDGIDGLAGWEGVSVPAVGAFLFMGSGSGPALATAAAVSGFLVWNWPRARIFMGDVGSGFLGYVLGVYWLSSSGLPGAFWGWPILLGVFLVDATLTLLLRMYRGENWRDGHCSHAYQVAARRWGHVRVTLGVLGITLFWLTPWATLCAFRPEWSAAAAIIAYVPLAALWAVLKRE